MLMLWSASNTDLNFYRDQGVPRIVILHNNYLQFVGKRRKISQEMICALSSNISSFSFCIVSLKVNVSFLNKLTYSKYQEKVCFSDIIVAVGKGGLLKFDLILEKVYSGSC